MIEVIFFFLPIPPPTKKNGQLLVYELKTELLQLEIFNPLHQRVTGCRHTTHSINTDIATYRLNWPRGRFSEKEVDHKIWDVYQQSGGVTTLFVEQPGYTGSF